MEFARSVAHDRHRAEVHRTLADLCRPIATAKADVPSPDLVGA